MKIEVQQTLADHYFGQVVDVVFNGENNEDRKQERRDFEIRREEDMYLGTSGYDEWNQND